MPRQRTPLLLLSRKRQEGFRVPGSGVSPRLVWRVVEGHVPAAWEVVEYALARLRAHAYVD